MTNLKRVAHVAILVKNIEESLKFWRDALGLELGHIEEVPSQAAAVAFLPLGETEVELVQPLTDDSGLAKYLAKRGGGMHHLCFEVEDIAAKLEELKGKGVRLISKEPVTLGNGKQVAFIHPQSTGGVLVELYQG
ncbi:MAG: methylmalonyl-CoA epimerase [Anaerolineaceae bacterium 4572_5.1]|nr:MAG: methylmalonyl-CoA epimerase [Anaerolinea sp. 4484_236]OQY26641.1 MAG: methylmalonyl-CoA epimerase [Anaerolineaceae bacterium 4572_5.1]RLD03917.1 MAG: methylmalonyl-CoA epimerase [Chloroflexota bacterium]